MRPVSVSLVEEMCETSTNYLNIIYNLPTGEKEKFAVCVKGLDFPMEDRSVRLVEWIEATMNLPPQIFRQNMLLFVFRGCRRKFKGFV